MTDQPNGTASAAKNRKAHLREYLREFNRWQVTVMFIVLLTTVTIVCSVAITSNKDKEVARQSVKVEQVRTCGKLADQFACVNNLSKALEGKGK